MCHNGIHDGVDLDHAEIDQLQCQEGVSAGQQHRSHRQEKQPGVMPVQKHDIVVSHAPMRVATGTCKSEKNRSPAKITTIRFCTLDADCAADFDFPRFLSVLFSIAWRCRLQQIGNQVIPVLLPHYTCKSHPVSRQEMTRLC